MKAKEDFGFIFWMHLILILIAYSSPFFFRWQLIFAGVLLLLLQQIIFQGCVLTHIQFGKDPYMTFYYKYLTLLGFNINKQRLKFLMAWVMPILVLLLALIWQLIFSMGPLVW